MATTEKPTGTMTDKISGGYNSTIQLVRECLRADIVPFVWGPPGVGKTTMMAQLAEELKLPLVMQILSHQADPADLLGGKIPGFLEGKDGKKVPVLQDCVPDWFKLYYEKNEPILLFLDEVPNSPATATTILNSIMLERRIGSYKLPVGTKVACAGNRLEDQCMVYPLSAALQQRVAHVELAADVGDFSLYAKKKGFEPQIPAFINWKGMAALITHEGTYPRVCPRVWEMADKMLKTVGISHKNITSYLGTIIGLKMAVDFKVFLDVWHNVNIEALFSGDMPDFRGMDESTKYATSFAIANEVNKRYRSKTPKIDWTQLSKIANAPGFPASLMAIMFFNMDTKPLDDAATVPAFAGTVEKIIDIMLLKNL